MYVRVWRYEVHPDAVAEFVTAYGPSGDWDELFARGEGYGGTELFRGTSVPTCFVTIDRWSSRDAWERFRADWTDAYTALDAGLDRLTAWQEDLVPAAPEV